MAPIVFFEENCGDSQSLGGKGRSLAEMTRWGFPVPPGFCITTEALGQTAGADAEGVELAPEVSALVLQAYRRLGGGLVAVRSSAAQEDGETVSFAGQQESILGVEGEGALLQAVARCAASAGSARARAYRQRKEMADDGRMAVVVQRMVKSEVSGVLFTRDPLDPTGQHMLVEAAWGLGEGVVSGRVTPDRYRLDRVRGRVVESHIADKARQWTLLGESEVAEADRRRPCLNAEQLAELARLAAEMERCCGAARDIEWAWAGGELWVLQARPITTPDAFEREQVRREEIAACRKRAEPRGTVWSRYNLAEVLPAPTPMSWAVFRQFLSGGGGYGAMLRDLGFDPDPRLDEEGFVDLICGRPYVNLSREPKLYFKRLPLWHPTAMLKSDPTRAMYPQPVADPQGFGARFLLGLPGTIWRIFRNHSRLKRFSRSDAELMRRHVFPSFAAETSVAAQTAWGRLTADQLLERFEYWRQRTFDMFARQALRPSVLAGRSLGSLERTLRRYLPPGQAGALVRSLLRGVRPDPEADLPEALRSLASGRLSRHDFLVQFGHRGPNEMELAEPRWAEAPDLLPSAWFTEPDKVKTEASPAQHLEEVCEGAELGRAAAAALRQELEQAATFIALRETAKHYWMMGHALLRRALVELDGRFELGGGIFYLQPDELGRLVRGEEFREVIVQRRRRRAVALSLEAPVVLFSDDLEALGRPPPPSGREFRGLPISAGLGEGPALVRTTAPAADESISPGFILVCPSTDPAWTPLFLKAKGLVMETGGVLSHGAIVAREFGLPAVAGVAEATRMIRTGQRLRVDGNSGLVERLEDAAAGEAG